MTKPKKLSIHQLLQDIQLTTMDLPTQPPLLSNLSMVLLLQLLLMPLLMLPLLNLYTKEHRMVKILLNLILTHGFILTLTHTSIDFLTEESRMLQRETHIPHHKVKLHLQLHGTKLINSTKLPIKHSVTMKLLLSHIKLPVERKLLQPEVHTLHLQVISQIQLYGLKHIANLLKQTHRTKSLPLQSKSQLLKRSLML